MFGRLQRASLANKNRKEKKKIAARLRHAAAGGDLDEVLNIIKNHGHDLEIINDAPKSSGYFKYPDGSKIPIQYGNAVWWAAFNGQLATLKALLEVPGIEINALAYEHQMNTPILTAIIYERKKVALELAARPDLDPNKTNIWGDVPILTAISFCPEVIPVLLQHPKINPNVKDGAEQTALHILCKTKICYGSNTQAYIDAFAHHPKIEIDARDDKQYTPLMRAAEHGNQKACHSLLQAGANKELVNGQNCHSVRLAELNGHMELARFIQNYTQPLNQTEKESTERVMRP